MVSVVRPRQRESDGSSRTYDPQVTLVRSLPLPGYRGLHIGFPAAGVLRGCWTRHRPEVVYVATQGPLGWSALRVAEQLRIPIFSGFHTNFDTYAKHYHAGWLRYLILRYLYNFHSRTDGTIVPCEEMRDRLRAMGLENINVLGRGVDSRLFTPERRSAALRRGWRAGSADLVALYVGRIAAEKNLALAIESYHAMQRVSNAVKFVLVGDGPLRAELQKKASGVNILRRTDRRALGRPLRFGGSFSLSERNRNLRQCDLGSDGQRLGRGRLRLCGRPCPYQGR
jgi:glycosyltransferase involved in cell wall biosynthesis